jgi:ferredoxin--NADP+ reductase
MSELNLNAIVTQKTEVAPGLMILRVSPKDWVLPGFIPGQFAVLGLPGSAPRSPEAEPEPVPSDPQKLIRRAYSISSASQNREHLEFYISLVRSGALTPRLFALKIGDGVWLSPKVSGMFTLKDVPAGQNIVLIATGTGLAPYISMLRTHLDANAQQRFAVLHGAYHSWDLGYRTELFTMQRLCPNFAYLPIISDPTGEVAPWKGPSGYVQDLWKNGAINRAWGFHPNPSKTHVFLCGHPGMIEDVTAMLITEGFAEHSAKSPGQIHTEKYW